MPAEDDLLGPEAMAKVFGVNKRTFLERVRTGHAPAPTVRMGKTLRWRWGAVLKWFQAMETLYGVGFMEGISRTFASFEEESGRNATDDEQPPSKPPKKV